MNYIDKTKDGLINSKNVVKLYDIVLLRKGYWKNKLAIITATKPETKHIHLRVIENGMDMSFSLKDVIFVNHNTKAAAKAYFDLCEKLRQQFINKYSDINYIKENFDTDLLICNDIVAATICKGAGIYISNNQDRYSMLAVNWLSDNKELISAIIRLQDKFVVDKLHSEDIAKCGLRNYIKLINYFYGKN